MNYAPVLIPLAGVAACMGMIANITNAITSHLPL